MMRNYIDDKLLDPIVHQISGKNTGITLADRVRALLSYQKRIWKDLSDNYESLENILVKEYEFDHFSVKVQYNGNRFNSTTADVGPDAIKKRSCFLCLKNLPKEQTGIRYYNDYLILSNPSPIFPEHFTIAKINHVPQALEPNVEGLLRLTKDLSEYFTIIYNGPECGASAPDHMHFQCFTKEIMPVEKDECIQKKLFCEELYLSKDYSVYAVNKYLRNMILVESENAREAEKTLINILSILGKMNPASSLNCTNIISFYKNKIWKMLIVPRRKHRPSYYFLKEKNGL